MKYSIIALFIFMLLITEVALSQTTITGKVTDMETGQAMIGVAIKVEESSVYRGTIADLDGDFSITIEKDELLSFTYLGYEEIIKYVSNTGDEFTVDIQMLEKELKLDAVMITANKIEENLQEVAISANVITGLSLDKMSAKTTLEGLNNIPNLTWDNVGTSLISISIRGLSTNFTAIGLEQSVGMYINEVYQPRGFGFNTTLLDIDRIEVLRGPQGTMFGKNTSGGLIHIISEKPKMDNFADVELSVGNFNFIQTRLMGNAELVKDKLALRVAGAWKNRDGVSTINNNPKVEEVNKSDYYGVRLALLYKPSEKTNILLEGEYSKNNSAEQPRVFLSSEDSGVFKIPADDWKNRESNTSQPFFLKRKQYRFSSRITSELGEHKLTSISAYNFVSDVSSIDIEYTFLELAYSEKTQEFNVFSQEFRFNSAPDRKITYVAGLYAAWETIKGGDRFIAQKDLYNSALVLGIPLPPTVTAANFYEELDAVNKTDGKNYAVFATGNLKISESLKVSTGVRFTHENKKDSHIQNLLVHPDIYAIYGQSLSGFFGLDFPTQSTDNNFSIENNVVTANVSILYSVLQNFNTYASYSRGFKGAGFNFGFTKDPTEDNILFKPEYVDSYELGLKWSLKNRLRVNLSGYFAEYNNKQEAFVKDTGLIFLQAKKAGGWGIESSLNYLILKGLNINISSAIQDMEFKDFVIGKDENGDEINLKGNKLERSPDKKLTISPEYFHDISNNLKLLLRTDLLYTSDSFNDFLNTPQIKRNATTIVNARVGLTINKKISCSIWGKNLTNEIYFANGFDFVSGRGAALNAARTFGADFKIFFY